MANGVNPTTFKMRLQKKKTLFSAKRASHATEDENVMDACWEFRTLSLKK